MRNESIEQLKEILKIDAMYHKLKFEHDVYSAGACIKEALDILRIDNNDRKGIIPRLEKIYSEFCDYDKLKRTKTNYTKEFEEKKERAKNFIQSYVDEAENS